MTPNTFIGVSNSMPRFVVDVAAFYLSCGSSDIFMFSSKHEIQNWKRKGKIYVRQEAVST